MKLHLILFFLISLLYSCNSLNDDGNQTESINNKTKTQEKLSLIIQPFEGLPVSTANSVADQLKEIYSGDIIIKNSIQLPPKAFNFKKKRYRADSLIRYLGTFVKDGQLIIGLTSKDISATKGGNPDYGIMGLGFCPGRSCIASTYRLKGKNSLKKLFKVAIHELGHTQGVAKTKTKHCPDKTCLMRDMEGKDHWDELKDFCSKCKPVLIKAGLKLK